MSTISTRTLSSGLTLACEPMPGVKSVGVCWLIPAGSATDPADQQGLCAMVSELLFRGSAGLDSRAHADALDRVGAARACTAGTFYQSLTFSVIGHNLRELMPLVVGMVREPAFAEDSIEPARQLCLQAIESLADDPRQRASNLLRERHLPTPINRSGLGTTAGLNAITRDDLLNHWHARARPAGSILALAGDIDDAEVAQQLDHLLEGWEGRADLPTTADAPHKGTFHHETDKSAQVQVMVTHDGPREADDASTDERIINSVLSGGMSARLFTEVREKRGLCYAVSAAYRTERDFGRSIAYVGTTPERAQESLDVLMAELGRINGDTTAGGGITQEELDRALVGLKSSIVMSGESTDARASHIASDIHKIGRARTLDDLLARFEGYTLDRANTYLAGRRLGQTTIVTLGSSPLRPPASA